MGASQIGKMTVYPANKLEDLAALLERVINLSPGGVLEPSVVIVESKGMQHWLNMALAGQSKVSMNVSFPMPGNFIWQVVRNVLGAENLPSQSLYQREALAWRLDRLLGADAVVSNPLCIDATGYWRKADQGEDRLKRYQLASALADLFEQYMLFRPDWIAGWESSEAADEWQAYLWRALVAETPDHPVRLQRLALAAVAKHQHKLPPQVCLFAINTLPQSSLEFFNELARYTQVHLFHLNPCVEYWGSIQAEKNIAAQQVRQLQADRWLTLAESGSEVGNPLLANLGTQGREFFSALQGLDAFEISAFEAEVVGHSKTQASVLERIQDDILQLVDARDQPVQQLDDSITFSASHSALRELQTLHDWLLHQFNADPSLTPRDILVMCPQVEAYAPYVGAVFDDGNLSEDRLPRIPCSITDRSPKDAEPLVSTFLELLSLPDSRFQVSSILDFLRLPALQQKFGLQTDELAVIEWWLREACVHWGLDSDHKQHLTGQPEASAMFSWSWGLRRLLLGFAQGDHEAIVDGELLLPHIEGEQALLLGRLMQVLERLQLHAQQLNAARSGAAWGEYLRRLKDDFFASNEQDGNAETYLSEAVEQMVAWIERVGYELRIPLSVVRYYLSQHMGQPDGSNRFMTGQLTFCSMTPMRSTPFKIVAILGLNDGEYPRQSVPSGFDLIAQHPRRPGDRSRRGDDRYLFLEALISTRDKLYLSYQGADIKNNAARQPSLILSELMDYLHQGYGWSFAHTEGQACQLTRQPLHPFSADNFSADNSSANNLSAAAASFDARWLALGRSGTDRDNLVELDAPVEPIDALDIEALVRFLDNPPQVFAEQRLGLYLDQQVDTIDDTEPFAANKLQAYLTRAQMLAAELDPDAQQSVEQLGQIARLSGRLPDSLLTPEMLQTWQEEALEIAARIGDAGGTKISKEQVRLQLGAVVLTAELPWVAGQDRLLLWRPSNQKPKDQIRLWLYHLCALAHRGDEVITQGLFLDQDAVLAAVDNPSGHLEIIVQSYLRGICTPLALHAELGLTLAKSQYSLSKSKPIALKADPEAERRKQWHKLWLRGAYTEDYAFSMNTYVRWFWPAAPELDDCWESLAAIYIPATECLIGYQGGDRDE